MTSSGLDFGGEITFLPLNSLAKREADEPGHFEGATYLAFGFLERLRDALLVVEDKRLVEERLLLVESFQTRFDDLLISSSVLPSDSSAISTPILPRPSLTELCT